MRVVIVFTSGTERTFEHVTNFALDEHKLVLMNEDKPIVFVPWTGVERVEVPEHDTNLILKGK